MARLNKKFENMTMREVKEFCQNTKCIKCPLQLDKPCDLAWFSPPGWEFEIKKREVCAEDLEKLKAITLLLPEAAGVYAVNDIPTLRYGTVENKLVAFVSGGLFRDILYVRETWYYEEHMHDATKDEPDLPSGRYSHRYIFKAAQPDYPVNVGVGRQGWRPSIHMPREAARIFLRVTDVRVERLQDISREHTFAEGAGCGLRLGGGVCGNGGLCDCRDYALEFTKLWDSTLKPADLAIYGWNANPWVWVIEFEKISKEEAEKHEAVCGS